MSDQNGPDVGLHLRALRHERGLSLRALAELSGLSPNTISLVERGVTSPSVSTLHRLATALAVPITALLEEPVEHTNMVVTRAGERTRSGSGSVELESLGYGVEGQVCDPFSVTLKPGANSGKRHMAHSGHELVYCLEGAVEYEIGGDAYRLGPGDALLFHGSLPHRWRNPNSREAVFLLIIGGSEDRSEPVSQHLHP
jgi:transcriptional regulator with XRE-family HTH domain